MGTKLKFMMKIGKISLIIFILFSCKAKEHVGSSEEEYVMAYKKAVLYGCLDKATDGNFAEFSRTNNDLGTAVETAVLYHSDVLNAKELGGELSKRIREINYSDYQGRKPIFSDCIEFAFNEYVDSIAKAKFKILKNSKLEYIKE